MVTIYTVYSSPPPPVIGVRLILQKVGQNFLPLDLDLYLFAVVSFILSKIAAILDKINVERPPPPPRSISMMGKGPLCLLRGFILDQFGEWRSGVCIYFLLCPKL